MQGTKSLEDEDGDRRRKEQIAALPFPFASKLPVKDRHPSTVFRKLAGSTSFRCPFSALPLAVMTTCPPSVGHMHLQTFLKKHNTSLEDSDLPLGATASSSHQRLRTDKLWTVIFFLPYQTVSDQSSPSRSAVTDPRRDTPHPP